MYRSKVAVSVFLCFTELTSGGFLVMLYSTSPLHFHNTPLNATVADVTEVLSVSLYTLGHQVSDGRSEASLILLKVLVVLYLRDKRIIRVIPDVLTSHK